MMDSDLRARRRRYVTSAGEPPDVRMEIPTPGSSGGLLDLAASALLLAGGGAAIFWLLFRTW